MVSMYLGTDDMPNPGEGPSPRVRRVSILSNISARSNQSGRSWNSQADHDRYKSTVEEMRDFCIGVPSIREVFKAKNVLLQFIWFGIFIFLLSMCLKEVSGLFGRFIESPTATKIDYKVNNTLQFPQVTLCSYVRVNRSKIEQYNISEPLLAYMMSSFKGMYLFYNDGGNQQAQAEYLEAQYQMFLDTQPEDFSLINFFLDNGIDCEQFFGGCMFQGADFDCCKFVTPILGDIGKCFIVSPERIDQIIPGPFGGMKLYINAMGDSYPETIINTNPDEGMQVHITNKGPSANLTSSPLITPPLTHAMIQLRSRFQSMLQVVDSNGAPSCTNDGDGSLMFFYGYTMRSCFQECIGRLTLRQCGCIQIGTVPDSVNRSLFCEPYAATTCILPLLQDNNASFLWEIYSIHDECKCPQTCRRWTFDTSVSYSSVPSPGFEHAWKHPDAWLRGQNSTMLGGVDGARGIANVNKKRFTIVDIFFDSLIFTVVQEQKIFQYDVFLGSMGGQLSVWLGIRLVNIIQLLYYLGIFFVFILPFWFRKVKDRKGWGEPPPQGPIREFKKPVSLYATASMRLLSPTAVLSYPRFNTSSRRSSVFSTWSGDEVGSRGTSIRSRRRVSIYSVGEEPTTPGGTRRRLSTLSGGLRELRVDKFVEEEREGDLESSRPGSSKSGRGSSGSHEIEMVETSSSSTEPPLRLTRNQRKDSRNNSVDDHDL